jgi:hypothetical protein
VSKSRIAPAGFPGKVCGVARQGTDFTTQRGDAQLWAIALGFSVLANAAILILVGFATLEAAKLRQKSTPPTPPPSPSVVMIFPELAEPAATPANPPPSTPTTAAALTAEPAQATPAAAAVGPRFARTSADQSAPRPESASAIGERNTQATSDRAPVVGAPALPSQAGVAPQDAAQLETTESKYQDGHLDGDPDTAPDTANMSTPPAPSTPAPVEPAPAMAAEPGDLSDSPEPTPGTPPPREPLLDGPHPVDVPVPRETPKPQASQAKPVADAPAPSQAKPAPQAESTPPAPKSPGFKGFQRKTAVVGSISRTGRSALDVVDSPLGRYQAALSRAVEQEWQRNCVRHRDFITPGFLTVRFFVEASGKVRSVQFVGDMETGEVQKGFTLNAIRDAEIPAMPATLRREYDQEPLELLFRFYF